MPSSTCMSATIAAHIYNVKPIARQGYRASAHVKQGGLSLLLNMLTDRIPCKDAQCWAIHMIVDVAEILQYEGL